MLALLLVALLFIVLFAGLGVAVSPLFFILLLVVLLLALGGGFYGRGNW
jgi:hypothetical protein